MTRPRWSHPGLLAGIVLGATVLAGVLLAGAGLVLGAGPASAAPADPRVVALAQPDGSTFSARLWGDEFVNGYETEAGYTVVRGTGGRWEYAARDAAGRLQPTGTAPVGRGEPPTGLGLRPHQRDRVELRRAEDRREAAQTAGRSGESTSTGPAPTLVVLARFTDRAEQTAPALWHDRFFGPTASVADYYDEVSLGQLQVVPAAETSGTGDDGVVGWVDIPTPHPDTGSDVGGDAARQLTVRALTAADPFVDFAAYDTRAPLGQLTPDELHLVIVPAGSEAADGCAGPTIWAHRGALTPGDGAAAPPVLDGIELGDGEVDGGYVMASEMGCDGSGTYPQSIGVFAHELGHDLGFVDLYDIDGSTAGVDQWSLMGQQRGQLPGEPSGTHPPHLDPFHKWFAGWVSPMPVTAPGTVDLDQVETSGAVALVGENPGGVDVGFLHHDAAEGEYFLLENREPTGYDAALPGCGTLIWHVDETAYGNADESRRLVDVEEAGEAQNPDGGYADASDPWPGSSGATTFDTTSTPDSRRNDGVPTGVSVTGFDPGCATTAHATVDPGAGTPPPTPPPPANDDFADALPLPFQGTVTGYNIGATREPGEPAHAGEPGGASVWWTWTAPFDGTASVAVEPTFDGVVAVYAGNRVDDLTELTSGPAVPTGAGAPPAGSGAVSRPEDLDVGPPSFPVAEGRTYHVAVDGRATGGVAATGGIRVSMRADQVAVTVTPTTATPAAGATVQVEVAVRDLDPFFGLTLYGAYDDQGHECQPTPDVLGSGETARCSFAVTAPTTLGTTLGSIVSVSGQSDDTSFVFHRIAWSAVVTAPAPPPAAPSGPPIALARTGAESLPLVRLGVLLLALGAACAALGRRRSVSRTSAPKGAVR